MHSKCINCKLLVFLGVVIFFAYNRVSCAATTRSGVEKPTSNGYVLGKEITLSDSNQVLAFLGIPYAEPPVGDLRFQPPVDKKDWSGVLNATEFGPICYQPGNIRVWLLDKNEFGQNIYRSKMIKSFPMSEDCLSLNIYSPKTHPNFGSLPVLVYIHGGSYGINSGRFYHGEKLASKGAVVVTCNYRLGALGFLSTGDSAATGNYGLLDQLHAFKWVQKNIANFGGDPNKVTIFGNSAGGSSVTFHMVSPLARGLFSSVIAESGSLFASWALQPMPREWATMLADDIGCPVTPSIDLVNCLRKSSPSDIIYKSTTASGLLLPYAPIVDGRIGGSYLPDHPEIMINTGRFHKVPFMTGVTRNEAGYWHLQSGDQEIDMSFAEMLVDHNVRLLLINSNVSELTHSALSHVIMAQYFYKRGFTNFDGRAPISSLSDFMSDVVFKAACVKLLESMIDHTSEPVYMYEFSYFSPDDAKTGGQEWVGAYHESELQYLFGMPFLNYSNTLRMESDKTVSNFMMEMWINFAKYGNPTVSPHNPLNVIWQPYTEYRHSYLEISLKPAMKENYLVENSIFWNSFFPIFRDYSINSELNLTGACPDHDSDSHNEWLIWFLTSLACLFCLISFSLSVYLMCRRPSAVVM